MRGILKRDGPIYFSFNEGLDEDEEEILPFLSEKSKKDIEKSNAAIRI
jgi:hypothetical protein